MPTLDVHRQAEELREQDKHPQALNLYSKAIVEYQKNGNYEGVCDALGGQTLTYKHLYLLDPTETNYQLALGSANASLKIAQKHDLKNIYLCYFRLGEIYMLKNDYSKAIEFYNSAVTLFPKENAEKGDFIYHLGEAQYKSGQKKLGLNNLLLGLDLINKYESSTDSYLINVWKSGCYLHLAEVLFKDDPQNAKYYFEMAKNIIESDKRLIIRQRQLSQLIK